MNNRVNNHYNNKDTDIRLRTFNFAKRIIDICEELPKGTECNILRKQLFRSGTSIGANVEEADGAETKADTANKLCIARKEARETRYWLKLIADKYIASKNLMSDMETCSEFIKILSSIINKLKSKS